MTKSEYAIVTGDTIQALERRVAVLINSGWKPMGGIAVRPSTNELLQAVVREYNQVGWV